MKDPAVVRRAVESIKELVQLYEAGSLYDIPLAELLQHEVDRIKAFATDPDDDDQGWWDAFDKGEPFRYEPTDAGVSKSTADSETETR